MYACDKPSQFDSQKNQEQKKLKNSRIQMKKKIICCWRPQHPKRLQQQQNHLKREETHIHTHTNAATYR